MPTITTTLPIATGTMYLQSAQAWSAAPADASASSEPSQHDACCCKLPDSL